jgi:hypothetical protein
MITNHNAGTPANPTKMINQSQGTFTIKHNQTDYPITMQVHHQTQPK